MVRAFVGQSADLVLYFVEESVAEGGAEGGAEGPGEVPGPEHIDHFLAASGGDLPLPPARPRQIFLPPSSQT